MLTEKSRKALQRARWKKGWTQERLAKKAKVSVSTISNLERGEYDSAQGRTIYFVAEALGLDADELLEPEEAAS